MKTVTNRTKIAKKEMHEKKRQRRYGGGKLLDECEWVFSMIGHSARGVMMTEIDTEGSKVRGATSTRRRKKRKRQMTKETYTELPLHNRPYIPHSGAVLVELDVMAGTALCCRS